MNNNLVNCNNVYVSSSTVCDGFGAFAKKQFTKGELIETGIARILTNCNGHENPHIFTWSNELPNKTWAFLSGCATFYNSSHTPNVVVNRDFINNTFTIYAIRDLDENEELFHTYKSISWRECFGDIK